VSPEEEATSAAEAWLPEGAKPADRAAERTGPKPAPNGARSDEHLDGNASSDPASWLPPGEGTTSPAGRRTSSSAHTQAREARRSRIPDLEDPRELVEIQKVEISVLVRRVEELERQLAAARRQSQER
jgi:hypothetical protein